MYRQYVKKEMVAGGYALEAPVIDPIDVFVGMAGVGLRSVGRAGGEVLFQSVAKSDVETAISRNGRSATIQRAYNSAGKRVHYDPKQASLLGQVMGWFR